MLVKQQYLLRVFSQYGELRPSRGWDRFESLGHRSKFQWVSRFTFVTALTSLIGGQPNFARCLSVSGAGTLYIHFRGLLPLMEFCQVQDSLYVQILRSPILAALLHGTRVVVVSQTLRCLAAPSIFGRAAITLGIRPHPSLILWPSFYSSERRS